MFELERTSIDLLSAAVAVQRHFIADADPRQAFEEALELLLQLSESEFGTIGRVLLSPQGKPFLKTYVISNIAWDDASRAFYKANAPDGLEFHNLQSLLGEVIRTNAVVISNAPADDSRSGGLPVGHPSLESFLGVPFFGADGEILGMAALANRLGGYDDDLVAQLEPLCDAVGVMIVAVQREQHRREAEAALKQHEAALRVSEARYRTSVEHAADGLYIHDRDGKLLDVNRQACISLGYEREELIGKTPADFDREFSPAVQKEWTARLEAGETVAFDTRYWRKDGSEFPVEVRIRPFWANGERHFLSLARDITDRKLAEEMLRESEERFRALVEGCAQAVWEAGPHGEVISDSPSWRAFTGQTLDEWMGDRWLEAVHPKDRAYALRQWRDAIRSGTFVNAEFRIRNSEGHWRWTNVRVTPLRKPDGSVRKWVGMNIDVTEQREAEQALRNSEERFRALVDASSQIVWTTDADGKVVEDSPTWRIYTGQTYDKFRGEGWIEMVHPDDRGRIVKEWRQSEAEQTPVDYEYRLWHAKSQRWRWVNVRAVCLRNPDGSTRSWVGMNIDIDQRKRAEETVRQIVKVTAPKTGQDFFRILTSQLSRTCGVAFAFVAEVDPTNHDLMRTIAVSHHGDLIDDFTYDLRDTPCENVVGKSMCHYATGVQRRFPKDVLLTEMGIDSYLGLPLYASTGQPLGLIVLLHTSPMGQPEQSRAILRVVAARAGAELERRQAEEALHTSQRFIERIANASPLIMHVFDRLRQRIVYSNRVPAADLGYTPQEIAAHDGDLFLQILHPDDVQRLPESLQRWDTARDDEILETEYRLRDPEGNWHWILGRDTVFTRTPDGRVEQIIGTAQDITDWKRAEEELAERQAELLHASRLSTVGRMVAALSHEVAQPLSAISNFAAASEQILDAEPNGQCEALHEYIHAIADQNRRCGEILQRLRDFSRRTAPTRSPCDICQLLRDSVELVASELRRNGMEVRFKISESLPHVLGDRIQLEQVVVNLLTNARDAMHDQPEKRRVITVRANAEDDVIQFDVDDLGTGISDQASAQLFEPFYTTKKRGMGIGLSICRSIIEGHGGQIEASSNSSGGATFCVRLPSVGKNND